MPERAYQSAANWNRQRPAGRDINMQDAVMLLQWQAYGRHDSQVPALTGDEGTKLDVSNIPAETLQEVAKSVFLASGQLTRRQQRGLQHTARALLEERTPGHRLSRQHEAKVVHHRRGWLRRGK